MSTPFICSAVASQARSDAEARQDQPQLLAQPPEGYPALHNILGDGAAFDAATIIGYHMAQEPLTEHRYHGDLRYPGDEGFFDYITTYLCEHKRLLPGWTRQTRIGTMLYARVVGNPILLEAQAMQAGYRHALATAPGWIQLGEVVC